MSPAQRIEPMDEWPKHIDRPMYRVCHSDYGRLMPGVDMICADCLEITEAEFVEACLERYESDLDAAHARLLRELGPDLARHAHVDSPAR